jgi:hypothetical protein
MVASVFGRWRETISRIAAWVRTSCSGEIVRMSPVTTMRCAITLVLPLADPLPSDESSVTPLPPSASPPLNASNGSPASFW